MALIKNIAELKQHLPLTASSQLVPDMARAEYEYLMPVLGDSLLNELQTAYDDDSLTEIQSRLLNHCRDVLAPMAVMLDLPTRQVQLSDAGLMAFQNETSRKAFKWEYKEMQESLQRRGYDAMERLIVFLKKNRAEFPEWALSPYHDAADFALIRGGDELKAALRMDQPHRCYLLLKSLFQQVADFYIRPTLGDAYYEALNTRLLSGTLQPEEKDPVIGLLRHLRFAAVHLAMSHATHQLSIRFSSNGFTVAERLTDDAEEGRKAASEQQLNRFAADMERSGQAYLQKVKMLLNANASAEQFPEYFASPSYEAAQTSQQTVHNERTGFFIM